MSHASLVSRWPIRCSTTALRSSCSRQHRCVQVLARATREDRSTWSSASTRILRYPGGDERRIIYPEEPVPEVEVEVDEWWSLWTQEDEFTAWNECSLAGAACHVADPDPLLEELSALQHRPAPSTNVNELVKGSYQILTGSPWLLPRPLFVLAQEAALPLLGGEAQATLHCLPTRIAQQGVQDELADLLKLPGLATSLSCSRMRDGVLAFDRAEDAARYATCLEADVPGQVEVMEVDSRQLFLLTGDAQAVVVYLPWAEFMPLPQQLAAALRSE